jgi:hypothetical protein
MASSSQGKQASPNCASKRSRSIAIGVSPHLQNIKAPLNGDDAAIRKYAQEMEALRKKVRTSSPHVNKLQTTTRLEHQQSLHLSPTSPTHLMP